MRYITLILLIISFQLNGQTDFISKIDPDAKKVIDAIQTDAIPTTLSVSQKNAINYRISAFKQAGLWTKIVADYKFIGGTASAHKYNFKDPRDLDVAYRVTWSGGLTHDANGVTPNGSSGWGNTHIIPINVFTTNNICITYSTNATSFNGGTNVGVWDGLNLNGLQIDVQYLGIAYARLNSNNFVSLGASTVKGIHTFSRNDANGVTYYKNGYYVMKSTDASSDRSSYVIGLFCLNQSTTPTSYSNLPCKGVIITTGLTATEAYNLSVIDDTTDLILGRNNTDLLNDRDHIDDTRTL